MSRSYLLRRPKDDDDYDYGGQELVRAKPIDARTSRNLGLSYTGGKDFVKGSQRSQQDFYGNQSVMVENGDGQEGSLSAISFRPLSHDERNKINASIIKAELKGDMNRVRKLKKKLEEDITEVEGGSAQTSQPGKILLMTMDKKSGLVKPATSKQSSSSSSTKRKETIDTDYEQQIELSQMVAEEKMTTAEQQITMFNRSAKVCTESKVDDDWVVDDNMMSHPKKRRHEEKDNQKRDSERIKEHKFVERTLNSCTKCIESLQFEKHAVVASGFKTYLAVVDWDGLSTDHCFIAPMAHYSSSVVLDEDVYAEMKLWMKGLVAMWRNDDEHDCVFIETVLNVNEQRHMSIECIPLDKEIGEMAPIYFKKAILESEKEWSDNKKLIDLSKTSRPTSGVRGAIPKGFPYFAVNFGLQPGYAHIIENERNFPPTFAQEIIAGIEDLPHHHWRNPKRQTFDEIMEKRNQLRLKWAKYDWTEIARRELATTERDSEEDTTVMRGGVDEEA